MPSNFDFSGRHVLITGGARGLGLEMSRQFLEAGARITIWDFSSESLECAKNELSSVGGASSKVTFARVDVGDRRSIEAAVGSISDLDVLVNNAGITRDKSFAKMTDDDFDAVINTNLRGVYLVTQNLLGKFKQGETPKRIVNIASIVALYGNFGQTNYVAAKAGVLGMTKTWARELARKGFTVNAIAPGFIATPMTEAMPPETLKALSDRIPVGRLGQPADIANACLFLASDAAAYINGITLSVDGGLVL